MLCRFWGVRGSIPTPGPDTVRYGGNTTCLEVRTDSGALIILDAGSGIRCLGLELARSMPVDCAVFLSHTHWDHIQGLPFFVPLFVPGNRITLHGMFDPVTMRDVSDALNVQMDYRFFPVRGAELKSEVRYVTIIEAQPTVVGDAVVTPLLMNHPVLTFGYKIAADGKTLFFSGDHEDISNIYSPEEPDHAAYEQHVQEKRAAILQAIHGVDVLIVDAQYTDAEYATKIGWGHSSYTQSLRLAREAQVGALYLTHHEPTRTDDALDAILDDLRRTHTAPPEVHMAVEGLCIEI